jgi:AcrR family transcriptional regulator
MAINNQPELPNTQVLILDAAINCVKRLGIERVTLNDIAKEANVARSTVYSYYTNKDDVVRFALLQSAYSFGEKVMIHLSQFSTAAERVIEAVVFTLRALPDEPCLALVTDTTLSQMVNEHTLTTEAGFDINTALFRFLMQDDSLGDEEVTEMSEFAIRTMFSLLAMKSPVPRTDDEIRGFVSRWLLPALKLEVPAEYQSPVRKNIDEKKKYA